MELNELIMESLKMAINETEKQKTSVEFGGDKGASVKDTKIDDKAQTASEGGLKGDIAKENTNPQGESKEALEPVQKNPNLVKAVVAGVVNAGAKITPNKDVKFTPSEPATK